MLFMNIRYPDWPLISNYLSHFVGSDSRGQPQPWQLAPSTSLDARMWHPVSKREWELSITDNSQYLSHIKQNIRDKAQTLLQLVLLGLEPPPDWLLGRLSSLYEAVGRDCAPNRWAVDCWWQLTTLILFFLTVRPIWTFSHCCSYVRPKVMIDGSCAQIQQLKLLKTFQTPKTHSP